MTKRTPFPTPLQQILLAHIRECYAATPRGHAEPRLSATYLLDYVLQHGRCPDDIRYATRRRQQDRVRAALDSLKRRYCITSSLAWGPNGGDLRCYEPAPPLKLAGAWHGDANGRND